MTDEIWPIEIYNYLHIVTSEQRFTEEEKKYTAGRDEWFVKCIEVI